MNKSWHPISNNLKKSCYNTNCQSGKILHIGAQNSSNEMSFEDTSMQSQSGESGPWISLERSTKVFITISVHCVEMVGRLLQPGAKWPLQAELIPVSIAGSSLEYYFPPPERDAGPSQDYNLPTPAYHQASLANNLSLWSIEWTK